MYFDLRLDVFCFSSHWLPPVYGVPFSMLVNPGWAGMFGFAIV